MNIIFHSCYILPINPCNANTLDFYILIRQYINSRYINTRHLYPEVLFVNIYTRKYAVILYATITLMKQISSCNENHCINHCLFRETLCLIYFLFYFFSCLVHESFGLNCHEVMKCAGTQSVFFRPVCCCQSSNVSQ